MTSLRCVAALGALALVGGAFASPEPAAAAPHNLVIFVADGLRSGMVRPETAPAMAALKREGVDFANSHALFPTVTTPNASAIATGHGLGDTGDFGNTLFVGLTPLPASNPSLVASVENDLVLKDLNARFGGDYLNEESLLAVARRHGFSTAAIGKLGPVAIQDVTQRTGADTIVIDDSTGQRDGFPLAPEIAAAIKAAGLEAGALDRGLNGDPGDYIRLGVHVPNTQQQDWFASVATDVLLPRFKAAAKPFVLVFWSRDPDGTQHSTGDSLNQLTPGINGATSLAAIRNADNDLARLRAALQRLGLAETTDVVVTADHGFSTVSKESQTSPAAKRAYRDVPAGRLPPGFVAIDLAAALKLPLHDANGLDIDLAGGFHPRAGSAWLGADAAHAQVVIGGNGGSDLIYLPHPQGAALAPWIIQALLAQDYVGALFVDDALGPIPGALPFSAVGLIGSARTPRPAIIVSFRSFPVGCDTPELCAVEVADIEYQQGQGSHGSLSRADGHNFMAAAGPDFKTGYVDIAPVSNADLAPTLAKALGLPLSPKGALVGRVIEEALAGGPETVAFTHDTVRSAPADGGFTTVLNFQAVGAERYFDAAGAPGRVVGVKP